MIYLIFVRGINVGGKNIVRMPMLVNKLSSIGFLQIKTYIQSGNIILKSEKSKDEIQLQLEAILLKDFQISTTVIVKTLDEMSDIIKKCPFEPEDVNSKVKKLYLYFFVETIQENDWSRLYQYKDENNRYFVENDILYLYCEEGLSTSKMASNILKMKTACTARNWNTVCKVAQIGVEM